MLSAMVWYFLEAVDVISVKVCISESFIFLMILHKRPEVTWYEEIAVFALLE